MEKIDFFGGAHGNFLELMINLFVYQIEFDNNLLFNANGACHIKNQTTSYRPIIKCGHFSFFNRPFNPDDKVIEIHCKDEDMLIAISNSLTRAGDQVIDITNLEKVTLSKLAKLPKAQGLLRDLINEHGEQENYPRSVIRNYFYSKFDDPANGIDQFNNFKFAGSRHMFPFDALFDLEKFYLELNKCAFFLDRNFYPTERTVSIWKKFIELNQGYHSYVKCQKILYCILANEEMDISNLNIVEEAWLLYKISRMFRCYDHPLLNVDTFVSNTREISRITYKWKKGDYPSLP